MATATRHQTTIGGRLVSWFEAGDGPALILLHGGGGTGKAWSAQLAHLSDRYRVIAPDLPGFGQSDWVPGVDTVDAMAPVLWQWVQTWGLKRLVVGGNSMGGRVALSFAAQGPDRVQALILLDSVGVRVPGVPIVNPLTLPPAEFMSGLVYDPNAYKQKTPYRTLEDARELNHGRKSFARYLASSPIAADPRINLSVLTMPSLLIWGKYDRIVPVDYGRALAKALPQAELLVIDACGHLPHIEEPDIVNRAIRDFLDRYPVTVG